MKPSKKKLTFPVNQYFKAYLEHYNRYIKLPLQYDDLMRYTINNPLLDEETGEDTFWQTVYYSGPDTDTIYPALCKIYALLKTDGDMEVLDHLTVARIDFCSFGNSQPFRVRIINRINDNYDHFYIKKADASRLYGLELEYILSPNRIVFLYDDKTLIEEHIAGIPGDSFMARKIEESTFNEIRIAKEFVKFNERCFVQLLGDMRGYNYIVDVTPDIHGSQFRIRSIDFDQQSYEGKKSFYQPKYFKENNPIVFLGIKHMSPETVKQYQLEERTLIATRIKSLKQRLQDLFEVMTSDRISTDEKVHQLKTELAQHHGSQDFNDNKNMGEVVLTQIRLLLNKNFIQSMD